MSHIQKQKLSDLAPKRGDDFVDADGVIYCMGVIDGYVMCRRPGCMPFVIPIKEWITKAMNQIQMPPAGTLGSSSVFVMDEANAVIYRTAKS